MSTTVDHDVETVDLSEYDEEVACTSRHCQDVGHGYHVADWAVSMSCTCHAYYCNWRMELYWAEDHEIGIVCTDHDDYSVTLINWIRIRQGS